MAWAEGSVSDRERELIVQAARTRGVDAGSDADRMLAGWLAARPSEAFFEKTLRAVAAILNVQPPEEREASQRDLLSTGFDDDGDGQYSVWIFDARDGTPTRLTFAGSSSWQPVWSRDGSRTAFSSSRLGPYSLFVKPAAGSGERSSCSNRPTTPGPRTGRAMADSSPIGMGGRRRALTCW